MFSRYFPSVLFKFFINFRSKRQGHGRFWDHRVFSYIENNDNTVLVDRYQTKRQYDNCGDTHTRIYTHINEKNFAGIANEFSRQSAHRSGFTRRLSLAGRTLVARRRRERRRRGTHVTADSWTGCVRRTKDGCVVNKK